MSYLDVFQKRQTKIPTVAVFIAIVAVIVFFTRFFSGTTVPSRAKNKTLTQLQVVNLSPTQAGIFWKTEKKEVGWVIYGNKKDSFDNIAIDERDLITSKSPYQLHFAILRNLNENTTYYFKIISDNHLVAKTTSGDPFTLTTPTNLSVSGLSPAYGKLINQDSSALTNALVLLSINGAYPFVTLTKTTGEWLIPLNYILGQATLHNLQVDAKTQINIDFFTEDGLKSNVITDIKNLSPLPQTTIIGKNYNFGNQSTVLGAETQISQPQFQIIYPKPNMIIPGTRPLVKGVVLPNAQVTVIIQSPVTYSFNVTADASGVFSVSLDRDLAAGDHTVTIITKDANGKEVKIQQNFTIAKSGEEVLGVATASATPTFFPTPTIAPTLVATSSSYLSPTPPRSGSSITPYLVTSFSLIILGGGLMLAF